MHEHEPTQATSPDDQRRHELLMKAADLLFPTRDRELDRDDFESSKLTGSEMLAHLEAINRRIDNEKP